MFSTYPQLQQVLSTFLSFGIFFSFNVLVKRFLQQKIVDKSFNQFHEDYG